MVFGISFTSTILFLPNLHVYVLSSPQGSFPPPSNSSFALQPAVYHASSPLISQQQVIKGRDDLSALGPDTHFKQESISVSVETEDLHEGRPYLYTGSSSFDELKVNESDHSTSASRQTEPARIKVQSYQINKTAVMSLVLSNADGTENSLWQKALEPSKPIGMISYASPVEKKVINLRTDNGALLAIQDDTQYIQPASFSQLSSYIYEKVGHDDEKFLYDVWDIVSHSADYSVEQDPFAVKPPLQTLLESKGDCEDLTILTASIISSLPEAKDWDLKLVYFNASDAMHANSVNHVALFASTGKLSTYIETTASKSDGLSVWKQVRGWYVDVVPHELT
jgi:hypothetical protein